MFDLESETLKWLRREYTSGTRIELVEINDFPGPPPRTKGTVTGVDDIGSIMVHWDNGSSLFVIYGEDVVRKIQ